MLARTALFAVLLVASSFSAQQVRYPGDGVGAFHTHHYRDLFAEQAHTPAETRAKLEKAFQQLFHGDKATQTLYFEAGSNANGPLAYTSDIANHDARTEGISYGMMIAVQMNHQHEFDAIWNWANTYMLITDPANPSHGYFAWSMNVDGTPRSDSPAPDGEEYMVMALYFADHRWGSRTGIYNYKAQADRILTLMRHHLVDSGTGPLRIHPNDPPFIPPYPPQPGHQPGERKVTVGPMVEEQYKMIRFVPNTDNLSAGTTDPSYHLPAFYELWSRWGPVEDRAFWAEAADVSRQFFAKVTGPDTGLTPDRANFDGSTIIQRNGLPVPFSYDSWRSISNWSVDFSWWHKDPEETVLSDRVQNFLALKGIHTFSDRYTLDGLPLSFRHSPGMVATAAVGSLAASRTPQAVAFVDELWNTPIPSGEQRYYDGMLYLMSMLHASGNFRIW